MNESPPLPSRLLKSYASVAKWSLWLLLTAWLLLALVWGALHGWIVPRIGELRPRLEIEATQVLGVPVRIGSISARSVGLVPSFELLDVRLLDPRGRTALHLPRVVASLSPRSLWNLGFDQLYIERPELDIRRAADGRIFVAGLDFSSNHHNDGRAERWFFKQAEFVIRGGTLRWTDELRNAPPLALREVDFLMRNSSRGHALRLDATPDPAWGERFTLQGLFREPLLSVGSVRWQEWEGQIHGDFSRVDVSQLRRYANLGFEVSQGEGSVRAWADVSKGQLDGGTADLRLANVRTRLDPKLEPLGMRTLSGRIGGSRLATGFSFKTENLQFETDTGQRWPGGNVEVVWTAPEGHKPARGELRADRLDLDALSQIASRLPLGTPAHEALSAYAPKGVIDSIQTSWQGPLEALQEYQARGRASGLQFSAQRAPAAGNAPPAAGVPGLKGVTVEFDLTQRGGKAHLAVNKGAIDLPGVFEDPVIPIDSLTADLLWQAEGDKISATVSNLKFSNADAQGEGHATWRTSDPARATGRSRFPGVLDLQANLSRANGTRVYRYLPQKVPRAAREYVREAVTQGTASSATFRVRGDLHDFPFADPRMGEFRVAAKLQNVTYAYVPRTLPRPAPGWPALTQLAGELVFNGNGMEIKGAVGRFTGAPTLQFRADAQIPDLRTITVAVTGDVRGPLAESLGIVNTSPVSAMLGQALAKATATGNADVRLKLAIPVRTLERSRVQGSVTFAANDVQITPDTPVLSRARGMVGFSESGFNLAGVQARALGGDVRLEGGSRPAAVATGTGDVPVQIRAQGTFTAEGLRQARELGFLSRLAKDATGGASYSLVFGVRRGVPEVQLASSLQGLALNLPAPLAKTAESALPLRFENMLVRDATRAGGTALQDQLSVELGRVASIVYLRDVSGPEPRVLRGGIAVGLAAADTAPLPEQGVVANVDLAAVNLDAWENVLAGASPSAAGGTAAPRGASASAAGSYLPTAVAVRAKELTVASRTLHNVVVGASRDGLTWRANATADELNGYFEYRQSSSGAGAGSVHARLARLVIASAAAKEVEALLGDQPNTIPAMDVVVDDFELSGRKLGRLEIVAVNRGAGTVAREGGVREWRLNKLNLTMPEATFTANGNWAALNAQPVPPGVRPDPRPAGERRRTAMNFRLDIADSGQLLGRFGMSGVVSRGKGKMEGQVGWIGSPLTFDYPSLSGNFNVNIEGGQFLKADPGLAKLLGVLSLQALPRRLTLDFRDVFSEGFAFDFVRGDVTIQNGIAATNNLQMKGVNAAVLMEGRADIARETQNLKVVVAPEINAGTAVLVATVINPAIGLGAFLAQMVLREPLIKAATQEFQIDGTWADPRMARVDRNVAQTPEPPAGRVQR